MTGPTKDSKLPTSNTSENGKGVQQLHGHVLADQKAWPQLESHAAGAVRCGASSGDVLTSLGLWSVSVSDQMSVIALEHVERALARVA